MLLPVIKYVAVYELREQSRSLSSDIEERSKAQSTIAFPAHNVPNAAFF